jgi:hypothetical protein
VFSIHVRGSNRVAFLRSGDLTTIADHYPVGYRVRSYRPHGTDSTIARVGYMTSVRYLVAVSGSYAVAVCTHIVSGEAATVANPSVYRPDLLWLIHRTMRADTDTLRVPGNSSSGRGEVEPLTGHGDLRAGVIVANGLGVLVDGFPIRVSTSSIAPSPRRSMARFAGQ